jgi:hypothetical protein
MNQPASEGPRKKRPRAGTYGGTNDRTIDVVVSAPHDTTVPEWLKELRERKKHAGQSPPPAGDQPK